MSDDEIEEKGMVKKTVSLRNYKPLCEQIWGVTLYSAYNQGGNGIFIEGRVTRFSATTVPFPASENAVVR
jgi:hypothetical protein